MKKLLHGIIPLLAGMITAQLVSTGFIYFADLDFQRTLTQLAAAGYVIVPNLHVLPSLGTVKAAVNGGLFFTLTIGLALSALTMALARLRTFLGWSTRAGLLLPALLWLLLPAAVNHNGFAAFPTTLLVLIPPVVFAAGRKSLALAANRKTRQNTLLLLGFTAFAAVLVVRADMGIFLNIRDRVLFSTSLGAELNEFYYENSLYSAHVFQSFGQQLIRPCNVTAPDDPALAAQIKNSLIGNDYLPVRDAAAIHFRLSRDELIFEFHQKEVLRAKTKAFLERPSDFLNDFSRKSDGNAFFRNLTMVSLLFSGALFLYASLCLVPISLLGRFLRPLPAHLAGLILAAGIALLFLHLLAPDTHVKPDNLKQALSSPERAQRIAALQLIHDKSMDIFTLGEVRPLLESPHAAERYWLARALAKSRRPESRSQLLMLLNDQQFNVVCMAYYALGFTGNSMDIRTVLHRLQASTNWYDQWYGYRTLRKLGWTQKPSI